MKIKNALLLSVFFLSPALAGSMEPIFSIVPTVKAPNVVYPGHNAIAYYKVTNNSPMTLTDIGLRNLQSGLTQDPVGAGLTDGLITCRSRFDLASGASCLLKLNITANDMTGPIQSGPEVCQNADSPYPLFCYFPNNASDALSVVKQNSIPNDAPTLTTDLSGDLDLPTGALQRVTVTNTSTTTTVNNITADFSDTALAGKVETITPNPTSGDAECSTLAPGQSCVLSLVSYSQQVRLPTSGTVSFTIQGSNSKVTKATAFASYKAPSGPYLTLLQSPLKGADIWADGAEIMSANYAFEGIQAVPNGETNVINAGGAWNIIQNTTPTPQYAAYTSTGDTNTIANPYGYKVYYDDAMPICFSEPIASSTVNPTDFRLTLNTGEVVTPDVASITPNFFYNETSCIVIFGRFGNRIPPGETGAVYPVTVSIVQGASGSPTKPTDPAAALTYNLTLYDANCNTTNMVGKSITVGQNNPYVANGGPGLLAVKLSTIDRNTVATTQNTQQAFNQNWRNDGAALYGTAYPTQTLYRLRMYTSGGFALGNFTPSANRSMSLMPSDYHNFFRVQVGPDSNPTYLYTTGVPYTIPGYGTITVVGLASLGLSTQTENDAYVADNNNYIDIIMVGDDAAMRQITHLDIPATGTNPATNTPYLKVYNPGGPGNNPTPGVVYTQPGAPVHIAVTNALDDANIATCPAVPP